MPRIALEDVEQRLSSVHCAICKASTFGIDRRTLQSDGECRGVLEVSVQFPCLYGYGVLSANSAGRPLSIERYLLLKLSASWRVAQLPHHHVGP